MNKFYPAWWHLKGYQMDVSKMSSSIGLIFRDRKNIARVIVDAPNPKHDMVMHWAINHGKWATAEGKVVITLDILKAMFGLRKTCFGQSRKWAKVLDADVFVPGVFIRKGLCLNVPGPRFADKISEPCLSIHITEAMKEKVAEFARYHS